MPGMAFPLPRIRWFLYLRSSIAAATDVIHGLKDTIVFGNGPPLPTAWATKTPALTAERSAVSNGFKKVVRVVDGGLLGPTDRLITSTPSRTACSEEIPTFHEMGREKDWSLSFKN